MEYLELEYMSLRSTWHPGNPPFLLTPVGHCPRKDLRSWNQNIAVTISFTATSLSKKLFHQLLHGREGCEHFPPLCGLPCWRFWDNIVNLFFFRLVFSIMSDCLIHQSVVADAVVDQLDQKPVRRLGGHMLAFLPAPEKLIIFSDLVLDLIRFNSTRRSHVCFLTSSKNYLFAFLPIPPENYLFRKC